MRINVKSIAHHRNGIAGQPFYVVLFSWRDGKHTRNMVATVFDGDGCLSVLDVDETAQGNIQFAAGNSWRGDQFETELRFAITEGDREFTPA